MDLSVSAICEVMTMTLDICVGRVQFEQEEIESARSRPSIWRQKRYKNIMVRRSVPVWLRISLFRKQIRGSDPLSPDGLGKTEKQPPILVKSLLNLS